LPDNDEDGLADAFETNTGTYVSADNTGTDPTRADSDSDGVNDGSEVAAGTNPLVKNILRFQTIDMLALGKGNFSIPESNQAGGSVTPAGFRYSTATNGAYYGGVPFFITDKANQVWHAARAPGGDGTGSVSVTFPIAVNNVYGFYTLAGLWWGAAGSYVTYTFNFSDGSSYSKALTNNVDLRDYNIPSVWANTINGTTSQNVFAAGSYHLDRQWIDFAAAGHGGKNLTSFVVTDSGAFGSSRIFLAAATAQVGAAGQIPPGATDTDGDGILDSYELGLPSGTKPDDADTDDDGLSDGAEIAGASDPLVADTDGDGLNDGQEAVLGANPVLADTDGDGLNDNVETKTGTYVSGTDTGTDPTKADTDGDGLNDGVETKTGTFVSGTNTGTDPTKSDTDADGVSDSVEIADGTNPNNAFSYQQTANFSYAGNFQSFTVPAGVTRVSFVLQGADGANFQGSQPWFVNGGQGGTVRGTLTVTSGQILRLGVGGGGSGNLGGWNGGGSDPFNRGGGGGGATDIFLNTTDWTNLVAIAGGGSGGNARDGFGGNDAGNGGNNGDPLVGSDGDGGGGGGGYFGGQGGRVGANGGGGTSWVSTNVVSASSIEGGSPAGSNGSIQLNYVAEPIPAISQSPVNATNTVGGSASFSVTAENLGGGTTGLTYQWSKDGVDVSGATNAVLDFTDLRVDRVGNYRVVVANPYGSVTSSIATLTVSKATPIISAAPTASAITYGQTLADSILTDGTASTAGTFAFTTPSTAPNAGTVNQGVTFTPDDLTNYNPVTTTVSVSVAQAAPSILLAATDTKAFGAAAYSLVYTPGSSSGSVSFTSSDPAVASISSLGLVTIFAPGTTTFTVSQAGDANYLAGSATQLLTVPNGDADGDGVGDSAELAAGTDPTDAFDCPAQLASGASHTLYIPVVGGRVLTWGANQAGQCGLGSFTNPVLSGSNAVGADGSVFTGAVMGAVGAQHSLVLAGGRVYAAGTNATGQLGLGTGVAGTNRFTEIPGLTNIRSLVAGDNFALARAKDGRVWAWGLNAFGQLGNGATLPAAPQFLPQAIGGDLRFSNVAAGMEHAAGLGANGALYTWGRGNYGQLGLGVTLRTSQPSPLNLSFTNATNRVTQIGAGLSQTFLLTESGGVWAFGRNDLGQLGLGSNVISTNVPTRVTRAISAEGEILDLPEIRRLSVGPRRVLAMARNGKVYGWGYNRFGELGLAPSTNAPSYGVFLPTEVPALFGAKEIAGGGFQTFALDESGTLLAAGFNEGGQLGVGSTNAVTGAPVPTTEAGKSNQTISFTTAQISAGPYMVGTSAVLSGSASSGLALVYTVSDSRLALVSNNTVTFRAPGTLAITARQGGDATFNAASPVTVSNLVIGKGAATVTLADLVQNYDTTAKGVSVFTSPSNLPVSVTYNGSTNPPVDSGNYLVVATVEHPNYTGSTTNLFRIEKAQAVLTWGAITPIELGTPLGPVQLNASAGIDEVAGGTFVYTPPAGTLLPVGTNSLSVTFTPNDANVRSATLTNQVVVLPPPSPLTLQLTATSGAYELAGSAAPVDSGLIILDDTAQTLTDARIRIEEGFSTGDTLQLPFNSVAYPGINGSYDSVRGILSLSGSGDRGAWQAALRAVRFSTTSTSTADRLIRMALGRGIPYGGHVYEFSASNVDWDSARATALGSAVHGEGGYLANVTSAGENAFVLSMISTSSWLGASDGGVEGQWKWVDGPEAGQNFWNGSSRGSAPAGQYANWNSGEPNNDQGIEDAMQIKTGSGKWNDEKSNGGMVIEYGVSRTTPVLFSGARTIEVMKGTPVIAVAPTASAITEGQALSASTLSGGTASVPGTFAWTTPSTVPSASASYGVTFTPTDTANYNTATTNVTVTVNTASTSPFANNVNFTSPASVISVPMLAAPLGQSTTLEFWIKPFSGLSSGTYRVASKNGPLERAELAIELNYSSSTIANLSATLTPSSGPATTVSVDLGNPLGWTHVAMVIGSSSIQLFADGIPSSSSMLMSDLNWSNLQLVFGNGFRGQIDDIRIYSGVRSQTQINADRAGPASSPYEANLKAYYKLDEGSGTFLADATGQNGAATAGNISWGPGRSPGAWDLVAGDYSLQNDGTSLLLELGGTEGTTLYDQIFVRNGAATLDGIVNLMFYGSYSGPVSGSWHTFDLIWAQDGIVFGDNYQLNFNETGYTVDTAVVEKDGGQLWQATIREAVSPADLEQAAALARPALGISRSPGPAGVVEMMYTYTRPAGGSYVGGQYVANGVRYEVQVSGDLKTWFPAALEEFGTIAAGAGHEKVTVKIVSDSPKTFLRLKVSN
jgi:alpha-tubulin suppressor-like RCC1 family protein